MANFKWDLDEGGGAIKTGPEGLNGFGFEGFTVIIENAQWKMSNAFAAERFTKVISSAAS